VSGWRQSKEYRKWRALVIRRDSRCVICNSLQQREAHHINHATYFIAERFDVNSGITLCNECHTHYHTTFHRSFREICTKEFFSEFLKLVKYIKGKSCSQQTL